MDKAKLKKFSPLLRGVAATTAALLTVTTAAYGVAKSELAIGWVDGFYKVDRTIYGRYDKQVKAQTVAAGSAGEYDYLYGREYKTKEGENVEQFIDRLVQNAKDQGEEGFALLQNDARDNTKALPLNKNKEVVLFGWNAYNLPSGHTGVVANNFTGTRMVTSWNGSVSPSTKYSFRDQISLYDALKAKSGITINSTVTAADFEGSMKAAGNYIDNYAVPEKFVENTSWKIKNDSTAIVVVGRGGAEGANYKPDSIGTVNDKKEFTQDAKDRKDPLQLSGDELNMIKYAKSKCDKVVLLVVSANAMELGPAVEAGDYKVDAIGFCAIPNDFQYAGIANVLAGDVNATGGLTDTYVKDNSYNPAVINMGKQQYADLDSIRNFKDPLGRELPKVSQGWGQSQPTEIKDPSIAYKAYNYIVEAEGIYVGYKYYETRYFDYVVDKAGTQADAAVGNLGAWSYDKEVIFPFGQSLSYQEYTQEITEVSVDVSENGKIKAKVKITNKSDKPGKFLAQLYVHKPYTAYDIEHNVEKSAVDFLNSAKAVDVPGNNGSKVVDIELPTRYLASWDSSITNDHGTKGAYILDEGNYLFTAAAGAHAAVNNFINELKKTDSTIGTPDTNAFGAVKTWNLATFNKSAFKMSNGVKVQNQMENSDINYFLGDANTQKVTYLSRSNWKDTFPKNYTDYVNASGLESQDKFKISDAAKKEKWLLELISAQGLITPSEDSSKWANVEGSKIDAVTGTFDPANGNFDSVWSWILSIATENPKAFADIKSAEWQKVKDAIPLDMAIASVIQGGGTTRELVGIGNPISTQSESVSGYQKAAVIQNKYVDGKKVDVTFSFNVASNTLLAASFNPALAYEWGKVEGESGLWLQKLGSYGNKNAATVWGGGLTQHRHPYCGRNSEYMSEDPMLANRIGAEQYRGAMEYGSINGPKHMGFNDQELNREGNACYMTEQKVRETDTRCFEGALRADEGNATGVMMSFARIGATNTTNSVGYIKNIIRGEWGFTGIVTTDMGQGLGYHECGALIKATVNELAGFGGGAQFTMSEGTGEDRYVNAATKYITLSKAKKDKAFADAARETALYLIYTLARSGSGIKVERIEKKATAQPFEAYTVEYKWPIGTIDKAPWEYGFITFIVIFGVLTAVAGAAYIAVSLIKKED